jgi:hypothetical protein
MIPSRVNSTATANRGRRSFKAGNEIIYSPEYAKGAEKKFKNFLCVFCVLAVNLLTSI